MQRGLAEGACRGGLQRGLADGACRGGKRGVKRGVNRGVNRGEGAAPPSPSSPALAACCTRRPSASFSSSTSTLPAASSPSHAALACAVLCCGARRSCDPNTVQKTHDPSGRASGHLTASGRRCGQRTGQDGWAAGTTHQNANRHGHQHANHGHCIGDPPAHTHTRSIHVGGLPVAGCRAHVDSRPSPGCAPCRRKSPSSSSDRPTPSSLLLESPNQPGTSCDEFPDVPSLIPGHPRCKAWYEVPKQNSLSYFPTPFGG